MRGKFNARKYTLDESYFEIIDKEEKAYFLGLLYADGCNYKNKFFTISLAEKDKSILEKFNKELGSNRPIKIIKMSLKNKNWQNQYRLDVYNQKMTNDLFKLGLVPNKSSLLKFPSKKQVPKHLLRHFIRGYFDGDGYIGYRKTKQYKGTRNLTQVNMSIMSNLSFSESLKKNIFKELGIKVYLIQRYKEKLNVSRGIYLTGCKRNMIFFEWIYNDSTIFFDRKYDKYTEIKNMLDTPKYKLISPDGNEFLLPKGQLQKFAKNNKLNPLSLGRLVQGKNKTLFGWKCIKL
jgi:hypothetical protein